jgi:phospholipid transport system substrate-binding protein
MAVSMLRVRSVLTGLVVSVVLGLPGAAVAADLDDAVAVVAGLHAALVDIAGREPQPNAAERVQLLAPIVIDSHDLARMGRLTVRRFWNDWSEDDRERFLNAFERLSIATYASRFAAIGPDMFEILDSELDDDTAEVQARIRRTNGEADVPMDYTLGFDGEHWRIINILADGTSELYIMGSRYFEILDAGDLDDLIADIETEIERELSQL